MKFFFIAMKKMELISKVANIVSVSYNESVPEHLKEVFQIVGRFMMQMYFVVAVNRSSMQEIFDKICNSSITTLAALIDEVERLTQAGKLTVELSRSASSSAMVAVADRKSTRLNSSHT